MNNNDNRQLGVTANKIITYIVYCHQNKINKKRYIGITNTTLQKRSGKNGSRYLIKTNNKFHQPKFARAILKYGWDNFTHKILFSELTEAEAKQKEIELIALYKTTNPKFGYNITIGGEGNKKFNTKEEKAEADKRRHQKSAKKRAKRKATDQAFKKQCSSTRKTWYRNKIATDEEYHKYVLQKSKESKERHKAKLTKEGHEAERQLHTANVRAARTEQKIKKLELQALIEANAASLSTEEAVQYINKIKWYKLQSMKKLRIVEQYILDLISSNKAGAIAITKSQEEGK